MIYPFVEAGVSHVISAFKKATGSVSQLSDQVDKPMICLWTLLSSTNSYTWLCKAM